WPQGRSLLIGYCSVCEPGSEFRVAKDGTGERGNLAEEFNDASHEGDKVFFDGLRADQVPKGLSAAAHVARREPECLDDEFGTGREVVIDAAFGHPGPTRDDLCCRTPDAVFTHAFQRCSPMRSRVAKGCSMR